MERPGLLYDELWVATYLGLREAGFRKVENWFRGARYSGVFANEDDPRWWASPLAGLLYSQCDPRPGEMPWVTVRRLHGVKKDEFSRCYACGNDYPETVAFLDASTERRAAMHLRCTTLHPHFTRELWFEDIRVMEAM
jgi:hypothetical protein